ncbi:TadE/TadG family type IV pilus assembly protein [Neorhizobium sp. NCHU2750]|uniref:TadE/TadG family type IV pilus assembly protein n=1 Tax=Neorhizobium sp. NCHU2750 TaxID=1825976 RepID=UPI000E7142BE|nr:pilus assembly protein TadG [Neorhizobium sp. NCHU2750]
MHQKNSTAADGKTSPNASKSRLRRLFRSKDGAAAIEFAILAIPYFLIVFAIIETFVAYTAEQLVANAVDTMGRKLRTGNITFSNASATTYMNQAAFRTAFCNEISILIQCSASEIATPTKLFLDVKSYTNFSDMPTTVPVTSAGDLDTSSFSYAPGGASTKNMLRAYYKWDIMTDLLRPYISNMRPTSGSNYFLIVETSAFKNEEYP